MIGVGSESGTLKTPGRTLCQGNPVISGGEYRPGFGGDIDDGSMGPLQDILLSIEIQVTKAYSQSGMKSPISY